MPEAVVAGKQVHYQDTIQPAGRTILFLHGAGGTHHSWRDQWAGLKGTARLVIPDLPGHGGSPGPPRTSIGEYAAWLREFVREAGLGRFVLAGHSMGGAIALQAALDRIGGLEALVLVATGAKLKVSPVITDGIGMRFREFARELAEMMMAGASAPYLKEDVSKDILSTRPETFLSDFRACDGFDVRERLGEIRLPTLVVAGGEDRLTPLRYAEFLATRIPGAVLKILPGAGHMVALENASEVNDVLSAFVHSLGG
ncbi:MAG TPA: hypothetical protein DD658_08175 [Deltaproteobacteria bacterium]|nr:MAG: hypothetical protein A2X88_04625 [Deltaproteobacteria bacterium GWC2_65_14]HBO70089.1 hypothetical protein [Deltaproteobacteria bacterium]